MMHNNNYDDVYCAHVKRLLTTRWSDPLSAGHSLLSAYWWQTLSLSVASQHLVPVFGGHRFRVVGQPFLSLWSELHDPLHCSPLSSAVLWRV